MTPVSADINNPGDLKRALRGAGTVVAVGRLGALPKVGNRGPRAVTAVSAATAAVSRHATSHRVLDRCPPTLIHTCVQVLKASRVSHVCLLSTVGEFMCGLSVNFPSSFRIDRYLDSS